MLLILYYKKKEGGKMKERKKNQYLELKVKCEAYVRDIG